MAHRVLVLASVTQPPAILDAGHRLGRYELLAPLAHGGMGAVWAARDHGSGAVVAVKTILPGAAHDAAVRTMFLDEARIAQLVRHPNVCRLLDFGNEAGTLYMVLEWVDGDSLRVAMKNVAPDVPPVGVALRVVRRVCDALHAAHELAFEDGQPLGLVHRDVSPHNVLVGLDGSVKLIDFGIAKTRRRLSETTTSGVLKGKLRYMAPEQVENAPFDRRADIWSLGAVLHYLAGGEEIFGDASEAEILRALVMHEALPGPAREVPLPVREVLARSLAFDARDRFATALEMRRAIDRALAAIGDDPSDAHDAPAIGALALRTLAGPAAARRATIAAALAPGRRAKRRRVAMGAGIAAATSALALAFALVTSRGEAVPLASAEPIAVPAADAGVPPAPAPVEAAPAQAPAPLVAPKPAPTVVRPRASVSRGAKKPTVLGGEFDTHD